VIVVGVIALGAALKRLLGGAKQEAA
jgi:hypothetical protein